MKKFVIIMAMLGLISCGSKKKVSSTGEKSYTIENLENLDSQKINQLYSNANIREGSEMFEEGTIERAFTILYPDTPDELMIVWNSSEKNKIYEIRTKGKGKWSSNTGIKVGDSYETLNEKNGKQISFYGFGWDYGGAVLWNGGKLENSGLRIFLQPESNPPNKFYSDRIIKASEEEIENLNLKVASLVINYSAE